MLTHTFVSYKNALKLVVYKWKPNWALHTLQLLNSWVKCSFFVCMDHTFTARVNQKGAYLSYIYLLENGANCLITFFNVDHWKISDNSIELMRMIYNLNFNNKVESRLPFNAIYLNDKCTIPHYKWMKLQENSSSDSFLFKFTPKCFKQRLNFHQFFWYYS